MTNIITDSVNNGIEIGLAVSVAGVPFLLVLYFHVRKNCHFCTVLKQNKGPRAKATHSMFIMFSIIIMVFLTTTVYPMIYTVLSLRFKHSFDLFHFFLLINNSINPFIYFAFSPPVVRLLTRLGNYAKQSCPLKMFCSLPTSNGTYKINNNQLRKDTNSQDINIQAIAGNFHRENGVVSTVSLV
jgi:hypothetical protein